MPARWLHQGPAFCPVHCLKVLGSPQIFADGGAQSRAHVSGLPGASLANSCRMESPGWWEKVDFSGCPQKRGVCELWGPLNPVYPHRMSEISAAGPGESGAGQEFQILQLEATKSLLFSKVPFMGTLFPFWESCVLQAERSSSRVGVRPLETSAMPPPLAEDLAIISHLGAEKRQPRDGESH